MNQRVSRRRTRREILAETAPTTLSRLPRLIRSSLSLVLRADRWRFGGMALIQVATGIAAAAQLLAGRNAVEALLSINEPDTNVRSVVSTVAVAAAVSAFLTVANMIRASEQSFVGMKVARAADARVLDVATRVPLESFDDPDFFDRLQRATVSATSRPWQMARGLIGLIGSVLSVAGISWALLLLEPWLLPFVALACVPVWILGLKTSRERYQSSLAMVRNDRQRHYLRRVLTGRHEAHEVRAFGLADLIRRRYEDSYDVWMDERRRITRNAILRGFASQAMSAAVTAGTFGILLWGLVSGRTALAAASAAAYGVQRLRGQIQGLVRSVNSLYECALFLDDLDAFIGMCPDDDSPDREARVLGPFERLVVEDVSFSYPASDALVLDGVSMEIRRGEVVALVGENGSGKTTLAKVLCQLYAPRSGRLLWDGVDTSVCDPAALRAAIAPVFQDFVRYELPAIDNIGVGRPSHAGDVRGIVAAARAAGVDAELSGLPDGYDTYLSRSLEGGKDLSVGQWQRVALARAFFRGASFVVLDEPTAAQDPRAEYALFERLRDLCVGRSVLLISHRFSTVRSADRIYVLERGRIVESGSHDDLMSAGGRYATMFSLQASAYGAPSGSRGWRPLRVKDSPTPDETATTPAERDAAVAFAFRAGPNGR